MWIATTRSRNLGIRVDTTMPFLAISYDSDTRFHRVMFSRATGLCFDFAKLSCAVVPIPSGVRGLQIYICTGACLACITKSRICKCSSKESCHCWNPPRARVACVIDSDSASPPKIKLALGPHIDIHIRLVEVRRIREAHTLCEGRNPFNTGRPSSQQPAASTSLHTFNLLCALIASTKLRSLAHPAPAPLFLPTPSSSRQLPAFVSASVS
jgi:hypothetical protein